MTRRSKLVTLLEGYHSVRPVKKFDATRYIYDLEYRSSGKKKKLKGYRLLSSRDGYRTYQEVL